MDEPSKLVRLSLKKKNVVICLSVYVLAVSVSMVSPDRHPVSKHIALTPFYLLLLIWELALHAFRTVVGWAMDFVILIWTNILQLFGLIRDIVWLCFGAISRELLIIAHRLRIVELLEALWNSDFVYRIGKFFVMLSCWVSDKFQESAHFLWARMVFPIGRLCMPVWNFIVNCLKWYFVPIARLGFYIVGWLATLTNGLLAWILIPVLTRLKDSLQQCINFVYPLWMYCQTATFNWLQPAWAALLDAWTDVCGALGWTIGALKPT